MTRRNYTMTAALFVAMGGKPAPEGYDPDARIETGTEGLMHKKDIRRNRTEEVMGTVFRSSVNPTDPAPGFTPVSMEIIQDLALYFQVKPLSIHWLDKYSPDFTAVPLGE